MRASFGRHKTPAPEPRKMAKKQKVVKTPGSGGSRAITSVDECAKALEKALEETTWQVWLSILKILQKTSIHPKVCLAGRRPRRHSPTHRRVCALLQR